MFFSHKYNLLSPSLREMVKQSTNLSMKNQMEKQKKNKWLLKYLDDNNDNNDDNNNKNVINDLKKFSVTFTLFTWGAFFFYQYVKKHF
jgi:hypothetical protein